MVICRLFYISAFESFCEKAWFEKEKNSKLFNGTAVGTNFKTETLFAASK